jgi:hypothetical protein
MTTLRTHPEWRGRKGAARWANHLVCVCGACRGCSARRRKREQRDREAVRVQAQRAHEERMR